MRRPLLLMAVLAGCTGEIIAPPLSLDPSQQAPEPACQAQAFDPGPWPMSRLTAEEYGRSVRDLLGAPSSAVPLGLDRSTDGLDVGPALAEQYLLAAEAYAATVHQANFPGLLPCDPASTGEVACARAFIAAFAERAFRRPLDDAELGRYLALFQVEPAGTAFGDRIEMVVAALLQSPHFLYRPELGTGGEGVVAVTAFELATRLSYFLWGSMPDAPLLAAARTGALIADPSPEVERMMSDPRARSMVSAFHRGWLRLEGLGDITKNPAAVGGGFSEAVHLPLFRTETEMFLDHVTWDGSGELRTLLAADFTFANRELATWYGPLGGLPGALPAGAAFERVSLDTTRRRGLLTHASVMAVLPDPAKANPVLRGVMVRGELLCAQPPPRPDDIDTSLPDTGGTPQTTRALFERVTSPAACSGCHRLINPVGFAFENFDLVGRWRDQEQGVPVDASGELLGFSDPALQGPFVGAPQLATKLAGSRQLSDCYAQSWFAWAFRRVPGAADACNLARLQAQFAAGAGSIRGLLRDIALSEGFRKRRNEGGGS